MPKKADSRKSVLMLEDVDPQALEARRWAGQIDKLETLPEDPRATEDRADLERWSAVAASPWARPKTIADAVARAKGRRTIWLLEAVDLMAFGTGEPPQDHLEAGACRLQACRALCAAAAEGIFPLIGMLGENSERLEPIAPAYLSSDYRIGRGSNVLEVDGSGVPEQDDAKFDRLHLTRWFDVRIGDMVAFLAWLSGAAKPTTTEPSDAPVVTDGRGTVTRAIQQAFKSEFPKGLPAGTSSQIRDEKIQGAVKLKLGRTVDRRTIQRALKRMRGAN